VAAHAKEVLAQVTAGADQFAVDAKEWEKTVHLNQHKEVTHHVYPSELIFFGTH
jgi:hypothetical protein